MNKFARFAIAIGVILALGSLASAQSWTPLTNTFPGAGAGTMLTLRDGRILVHNADAPDWWVLTPDATGNYVNGTWSSGGNLPAGYGPLYYGSQVLLDGKTVVIEGGEYNLGVQDWTNQGALLTYSGSSFVWAANAPPSGWLNIGDAQSVILADGRYMQSSCCYGNANQTAFFAGPNTWNNNPNFIIGPANDEGAYTLLPSGKVMMVDAWSTACSGFNSSEIFDPTTSAWSCGPNTPFQMWDNIGHELGPAVLMHNGKIFQVGANPVSAIYDPISNSWAPGPGTQGFAGYDAPASLEFNGKVLEMMGPPSFLGGCQMFEYDPAANTLTPTVNQPLDCPGDPTYYGHLMVLPSGQIMFTDFSNFIEVYNPAGSVDPVAVPTILASSTHVKAGSTNNILYGRQLNGLGQNNAYGDDYQGDTNYPLVRLTNTSTGNVYWALTHNESTHSIAPGTIMFTHYDVPASVPNGKYKLNVVTSGIPSNTIIVSVP